MISSAGTLDIVLHVVGLRHSQKIKQKCQVFCIIFIRLLVRIQIRNTISPRDHVRVDRLVSSPLHFYLTNFQFDSLPIPCFETLYMLFLVTNLTF